MPIEAELKARVRDSRAMMAELDARADREDALYRDSYFDNADGSFTAAGHELRIRTIEAHGAVSHLLTFKMPAVDQATGSKPELETTVGDVDTAEAILAGLGYRRWISFSKYCANYRLHNAGRDLLATVVTVPEIDGTYIELETITDEHELPVALKAVRDVLASLGIQAEDLTTELYTDAVRDATRA